MHVVCSVVSIFTYFVFRDLCWSLNQTQVSNADFCIIHAFSSCKFVLIHLLSTPPIRHFEVLCLTYFINKLTCNTIFSPVVILDKDVYVILLIAS